MFSLPYRIQLSIAALLLTNIFNVNAQTIKYGNEWINPGQSYYKIKFAETGIYRIEYTDLANAGVDFISENPRFIQLFHRGIEQAIYIKGEKDNIFDTDDYIEFYGEMNDGTQDSVLYSPPGSQPHKYYNLFSDTSAYYLTWKNEALTKRMKIDSIPSSLPVENYHLEEKLLVLTEVYESTQRKVRGNVLPNLAQWEEAEGWFSVALGKNKSRDFILDSITNIYTGAPIQPGIEILLIGSNNNDHKVEIMVGNSISNLKLIDVLFFSAFTTVTSIKQLNFTDIDSTGECIVRVNVLGVDGKADRVRVAYIKLTYPQKFDMNGNASKYFNLTGINRSKINIQDPPSNIILYDITDKNSLKKVGGYTSEGVFSATVDTTLIPGKLFAIAGSNYLKPASINSVYFSDIIPADYDYIIITHRMLMSPALEYAQYRASGNDGRKFKPLTIDVDHIYDQFGYGERSPVAIRRFLQYMYDNNPDSLKHVFIIGKGLEVKYCYSNCGTTNPVYYRKDQINSPVQDLVPTAGLPGSDLMYTMNLDGNNPDVPSIPIGRVSAQTPQDVINYLDKVKGHESLAYDDLWRKNILHLAGGKNISEQQYFLNSLYKQKNIAEGIYMGANVKTISKSTPDVQTFNIVEDVNDGSMLIQFFGHSSATTSEIDIGDIKNPIMGYENKDKYPMIIVNGCLSGFAFGSGSLGEDWILAPEKGALLYMAHSSSGDAGVLYSYTINFYNVAFANSLFVNKSIGEIQKETIRLFRNQSSGSTTYIAHAQEIILQGDPAIKLFGVDKPDLYTNDDQLKIQSYDNEPVSVVSDSFAISIITSNFGNATADSFYVTVKRTFPDESKTIYGLVRYPAVLYKDTLLFTIRSKDQNSYGLNKFEVFLDYTDTIDELNEFNNTGIIEYYMSSSGMITLFPKEYSIVSSLPVTLIAQPATDMLKGKNDYLFEFDSINTFNSPLYKDTTINSGIIVSWTTYPKYNVEDSTVFYWRVRFKDIPAGEDTLWAESSFIYIPGSLEGWSQSHFPQFSKADLVNVVRNDSLRRWEFVKDNINIKIRAIGNKLLDPTEIFINFQRIDSTCTGNGLLAVTFDKATALPYLPEAFLIGDYYCYIKEPRLVRKLQNFNNATEFNNYLSNVSQGDYVLLISIGNAGYESWHLDVIIAMKSIGASGVIDILKNGEPYILLGKKDAGYKNAVFEIFSDTSSGFPLDSQDIILNTTLVGSFTQGFITSTVIGPASEWGTLYHTMKNPETSDSFQLDVFGMDLNYDQFLIYPNVSKDSLDLSWIESGSFPYLRLQTFLSDTVNLTPPQLKKWQVIFEGVAEGIINPEIIGIDEYNITDKREGEIFDVNFAFQNISNKNFDDTLIVKYTITNQTTRTQIKTFSALNTLKAGDTLIFSHSINTLGLVGDNDLNVYVNPKIQLEKYYTNNILQFPFKVLKDNTHPILDVTFDGIHIMDGDIVSPAIVISISLKDENKYLLKTDTVGIEIFLKEPDNEFFRRIYFNGPEDISWIPAVGNNKFKIEYSPENEYKMYLTEKKTLDDGIYSLRVQGADVTGNESGVNPYEISFNIINESSVTYFYPYPNPFSTCTRFVYTLTGNDIPDEVKIQIMTVTGKVVREILQDELGQMRIGSHSTDFQWCGTDEFGDKLANGVYLYRVFIRNNGEEFKHRDTAADMGFKKNFGKLYILR